MLLKTFNSMFIFTLILGSLMAVSSNSWFTAWIGLEINLMSIIPLMLYYKNPQSMEACVKYFLPQALASVIIIMISSLESIYSSFYFSMESTILLVASISIKAGMAPFHFWFPQVMNKLNWGLGSLILTWQKVAPLILLSFIMSNFMMKILISASTLVGALGGLNQNLSKLIITYSSISHSGWMMGVVALSISSWSLYFSIYCSIALTLIFLINKFNLNKISSMSFNKLTNTDKINFILILLSLGGLPPLLGFSAKLSAAYMILNFMSNSILIILILGSLISLFYYMKLTYNLTMNNSMTTMLVFYTPSKTNNLHSLFSIVSILGNCSVPMLVSLI